MDLNEGKSFSKLQTQLFLRHCAKNELKKALDVSKKHEYKSFKELIMIKILRNNVKDTINGWKGRFYKLQMKLAQQK